jgi:hypothetical protein
MTRAYAEGTAVSVEKSKAELEGLLGKHGATQRGIMADDEAGRAVVVFVIRDHQYRLEIPLPTLDLCKPEDGEEPRGWWGWGEERRNAWIRFERSQQCRERWRAVVLLIKAKLELVRIGVSTIEREFLADLVLPNGDRLEAIIAGQIKSALAGGPPPRLLAR